ncbi:hypothetical protein C8R43DRAFT_961061 [Mycena crocata]|nr:hypothetical protein C8R43DRAFT_961061 [Mycena crocata]
MSGADQRSETFRRAPIGTAIEVPWVQQKVAGSLTAPTSGAFGRGGIKTQREILYVTTGGGQLVSVDTSGVNVDKTTVVIRPPKKPLKIAPAFAGLPFKAIIDVNYVGDA